MARGDTALEVWERLEGKMIVIISKLKYKYKFTTTPMEEIVSEVRMKFHELYYNVYEKDEQFLRFMFIVTKNIIHDMQRKEYRYANRHSCDLNKLRSKFRIPLQNSDANDGYVRIINEMAVDTKPTNNVINNLLYKETINQIETILNNPIHIKIFRMILEGHRPYDIAEKIDKQAGYIGLVKRKYIYPALKEVMNISDKDYEWLASSGRIFISK